MTSLYEPSTPPTAAQVSLAVDLLSTLAAQFQTAPGGNGATYVALESRALNVLFDAFKARGWTGAEQGGTPYGTPPTAIDREAQIAMRGISAIIAELSVEGAPPATLDAVRRIIQEVSAGG